MNVPQGFEFPEQSVAILGRPVGNATEVRDSVPPEQERLGVDLTREEPGRRQVDVAIGSKLLPLSLAFHIRYILPVDRLSPLPEPRPLRAPPQEAAPLVDSPNSVSVRAASSS